MSTNMLTTCHMTSTLENSLKLFLDAESNLTLNYNLCGFCYDNTGCSSCRDMANPRTYEQMQEDLLLRKAIEVIPVAGNDNKFRLTCEYPLKEGINLTYL